MISGIGVRIDDRDGWNAQPARLVHSVHFARRVDDHHRIGQLRHLENAVEVPSELGRFAIERRQFLFAHLLVIGRFLDLFDVLQATDAFPDGGEIGQRAAEPALIDIKLSAGHRRFLDRFLRLLLAADEQNLAAAARYFLKKFGRAMQLLHRFIEIDDVDLSCASRRCTGFIFGFQRLVW